MRTWRELLSESTLTSFQKKHKYTKRFENKCDGEIEDGICKSCGLITDNKRKHLPNKTGSLGYRYVFSDGSEYTSTKESENI